MSINDMTINTQTTLYTAD